ASLTHKFNYPSHPSHFIIYSVLLLSHSFFFFFFIPPRPPRSPLFPYTTLFRSLVGRHIIEALAGIPVAVEYASEYRYRTQLSLRSEEHTSELQSPDHLVCRLLLEKKKNKHKDLGEIIHESKLTSRATERSLAIS